jgi:hypothetical protein
VSTPYRPPRHRPTPRTPPPFAPPGGAPFACTGRAWLRRSAPPAPLRAQESVVATAFGAAGPSSRTGVCRGYGAPSLFELTFDDQRRVVDTLARGCSVEVGGVVAGRRRGGLYGGLWDRGGWSLRPSEQPGDGPRPPSARQPIRASPHPQTPGECQTCSSQFSPWLSTWGKPRSVAE